MKGLGTGARFQVGGLKVGLHCLGWRTLRHCLGCTVGGTSFKQDLALAYNPGSSLTTSLFLGQRMHSL